MIREGTNRLLKDASRLCPSPSFHFHLEECLINLRPSPRLDRQLEESTRIPNAAFSAC